MSEGEIAGRGEEKGRERGEEREGRERGEEREGRERGEERGAPGALLLRGNGAGG